MDSHYYKAAGRNIAATVHHEAAVPSSAASNSPNGTPPPDTSNWEKANDRDSNYIFAQHVADKMIGQLSHKYPSIGHQSQSPTQGGQDTTDSPHKVVRFKMFSSKNQQNKDETEYYLKIEVDTPEFRYVIAHIGVTPDYLTMLYESWTTNT